MNSCPYCSHPLLRHIRHGEIHFFCRHCWINVLLLSEIESG
jgi:hypothetical protein